PVVETTTEAPVVDETTTEAPDVNVPCEEHSIVDGQCEVCGFIPVFENASVYDNDGDEKVDVYLFTPVLPEKFQGEGAIHVAASTNQSPSGSFNTATFSDITHWYCIEGNNHYLLYTVEVAEAGIYEMAVHMRMKDAQERGAKYTVNEGTANEYVFETSFQFATVEDAYAARENDYTMSSYMFGIQVKLVAGTNTIKIQDSSKSPKNQHFRDFYFVKVADWTPAEDVVEPETLTAEQAIEKGLTYEKGAYSEEYYYVTLTLNTNANANGFARATLEGQDMIISVAGGFLTGEAEGSFIIGDTIKFLAKVGCVNSATTASTKEARLFEVKEWEYVEKAPRTLTAEEAIALGNTFEKGKYSEDLYYVTLTLNTQVNENGFARATLEGQDMIISVAGGYLTADAGNLGTLQVGDTVTFLAKVGCVNSATTASTKEARLFEVQSWEVVPAN
ncbi:MAG: hypothetical protein J6V22_03750, partial [Clostridia bacterium]|nr:hypothetical protein [Clostridia bacterium]